MMTTWQCSGCKRVWQAENSPAECICGCRLICESADFGLEQPQGAVATCSQSVADPNRMWVVLCCVGIFTLAVIAGIVLRQEQLAERARLETAVRLSEQRVHEAEAARVEMARRAEKAAQAREREEKERVAAEKKKEDERPRKKKGLVVEGFQKNKDEMLRDTVIELMRQEGYHVFPEQEVQRRIDLLRKKFERQDKGSSPKFA